MTPAELAIADKWCAGITWTWAQSQGYPVPTLEELRRRRRNEQQNKRYALKRLQAGPKPKPPERRRSPAPPSIYYGSYLGCPPRGREVERWPMLDEEDCDGLVDVALSGWADGEREGLSESGVSARLADPFEGRAGRCGLQEDGLEARALALVDL